MDGERQNYIPPTSSGDKKSVCVCVRACVSSMDIIRVNILFSYIVFIKVFVKILTNLPYNKATILTVDTQRHPKQQNF